LPLYPSYLSYISGVSVQQLKDRPSASVRWTVLLHTVVFVLGVSVIFYIVGMSAGFLGEAFQANQNLIRQLSAILFVVMGLLMLGVFQPQLLMKEKKWNIRLKGTGYFASFLIGVGFAAGWSPCIGPIISNIGLLAATHPGMSFALITSYVVGFGIPFIGLSLFISSARWLTRYSGIIAKIGGALMVIIGVLLYFDQLSAITKTFTQLF
jgi:cytochrome c-type biogenesis protein